MGGSLERDGAARQSGPVAAGNPRILRIHGIPRSRAFRRIWAAEGAEPTHQMWADNTRVLPAEKRDPGIAAKGAEELAKRLAVREGHLAQHGPFLLGAGFTIADLNLAAVL